MYKYSAEWQYQNITKMKTCCNHTFVALSLKGNLWFYFCVTLKNQALYEPTVNFLTQKILKK